MSSKREVPILLKDGEKEIDIRETLTKLKQKGFWKSLIHYKLDKLSERVRFTFIFTIVGIIWIILGNIFFQFSLKFTGVIMMVVGVVGIILAFVVPVIYYYENN